MRSRPLSVAQEQHLLLDSLAMLRGTPLPAFNVADFVWVRGALNVDRWSDACSAVVRRHPALRRAIRPQYGIPPALLENQFRAFAQSGLFHSGLFEQVDVVPASVPVTTLDLVAPGESEREDLVREALAEESRTRFSYGEPPFLRVRVLRFGPASAAVVIALPHVACDVPSLQLVWRDLWDAYEGAVSGGGSGFDAPPVPIVESPSSAGGDEEAASAATAYWAEQWRAYADARLAVSDLCFASASDRRGTGGLTEVCDLGEPESAAIRRLGERVGVAPYVLFFAAFVQMLVAATGRPRLGVWVSCHNRLRDELDDVVGWIANSHLLGIDLSACGDALSVIARCRETIVAAQRHQGLSLPALWRAIGAPRPSTVPSIVFDWHTLAEARDVAGVRIEPAVLARRRSVLAPGFCLRIVARADRYSLCGVYSAEWFDAAAVRAALRRVADAAAALTDADAHAVAPVVASRRAEWAR